MKKTKTKTPSLLSKLIDIHHENALTKKALRTLSKQKWSVEFLCHLCAKAAQLTNSPVEITIVDKDKREIHIRSIDLQKENLYEESILDKLDDTAAVNDFIKKHATR